MNVLIADDNHDAAESLAVWLRLEGHVVKVVHDGVEARRAFAEEPADAAILDIGMPGLNGYEVARHIRLAAKGRAVILIALTGFGQDSDRAEALGAGFDHHLTRPVEPERLSELLRS